MIIKSFRLQSITLIAIWIEELFNENNFSAWG